MGYSQRNIGLTYIQQGNPAQALTAARELASHPLYRHEMAPALVGLIAAQPRLSSQLFPMVERLAARESIPALVDLLFATDEAVKE